MKQKTGFAILLAVMLGLSACGGERISGSRPQEETQENQTEPVRENITGPEYKNEEEPSSEQDTETGAESFFGNYTIIAFYTDGIYAMSTEDINAILGTECIYTENSFSANGVTLEGPQYSIREETKEEFADWYGNTVTFENLNISGDTVKVVSIDNSYEFGSSFYIKNENALIIVYNGVWFEAVRSSEAGEPKENATGEIGFENTEEEQQAIYYERYYAKWDEDEMIAEMNNRRVYLDNCSFYEEANQFIENVLENRDISSLVEPLLPLDMVSMEKEDFEDFSPLMIHILKNEIYAMHGYIFQDEDLNNYFRGLLWYTPQYEAEDFDDSVFNEIERHNLEILAQLDTY